MTTASTIISRAAEVAGVKAIGQATSSDVEEVALSQLQTMLDRWANVWVDFNVGTLAASSTLYVDDSDIDAIQLQLSKRLARIFRKSLDQDTLLDAEKAFNELQAKYSDMPELEIEEGLLNNYNRNILTDS
jgi:hypothetical protein